MTKECNSCKQTLSIEQFYTVNKRNRPQLYHICIECVSTQKKNLKSYYRNWELQKKYGISIDEYNTQSEIRKNKCDICQTTVKSLHVDHSHKTGLVRGYLCGSCNRGIGLLKDSPEILEAAFKYLQKHD